MRRISIGEIALVWAWASCLYAAEPEAGYLGVLLIDNREGGASIIEALPKSPAAQAGLIGGDVVTTLNHKPIKDADDLIRQCARLRPGAWARLRIRRKSEEKTVEIALAKQPTKLERLVQRDPPRVPGPTYQVIDGATNEGNIEWGANLIVKGIGQWKINANLSQPSSGLMSLELCGESIYPIVSLSGQLKIGGILHVVFVDFVPKAGDRFKLIAATKPFEGRFDELLLPAPPVGSRWEVVYDDPANGIDMDNDGKFDITLVAAVPVKTDEPRGAAHSKP